MKEHLEQTKELGDAVVVEPPVSQSYFRTSVNQKKSTTVTLVVHAHNKDDKNLSGLVRARAVIDDDGVNIDRLELNRDILLKGEADDSDNGRFFRFK